MKSEYFIHEDYGMYGYEEQYVYGDISVNASKDSSMGVLLELRGMGCRNLEYVLQARGIDWYYFLSSCIDYQGVFKRIDLAAAPEATAKAATPPSNAATRCSSTLWVGLVSRP